MNVEVRRRVAAVPDFTETEAREVVGALGLDGAGKESLRRDVEEWYRTFVRNIGDPAASREWTTESSPTGPPMLSLRDVEEQVEVWGRDPE